MKRGEVLVERTAEVQGQWWGNEGCVQPNEAHLPLVHCVIRNP